MNLKALTLSLVATAVAVNAGCTWVKPVEGTEAVALVKPEVVQNCQSLGKTTVQVKDRVAFINRRDAKVAEELLTMARNEAVELGADSIVVLSEETDGKQAYGMYKCR